MKRKEKKKFPQKITSLVMLLMTLVFALEIFLQETSSVNAETIAESDEITFSEWENATYQDTKNIGQIWTDKSVSTGDVILEEAGSKAFTITKDPKADFLIGLSAISSTANITGKQVMTTPLDLVLVLDTSGSMVSANYQEGSKLDALKNAANAFIDTTAKMNEHILNAANRHRISIVTYASDATQNIGLIECMGKNITKLKAIIEGLSAEGATRADKGMAQAVTVLNDKRTDAKQVVIFFTDGEPTSQSEFEPAIAKKAIENAKIMKDTGTKIYSIGIFAGANPDDDPTDPNTSDVDKFMHAISSNYPNATSYTSKTLGIREKDSDYYKATSDAVELKEIFQSIASDMTQLTEKFPTAAEGSDANRDGYVTFTDKLGDYMEVNSFQKIIFADKEFSNPRKIERKDKDTYTFRGIADHILYPNASMSDIKITVTHGPDMKTGDTVTVAIPASAVPLLHYEVDIDVNGNASTKMKETCPIRIFYDVKLKDGVMEKITNPDDAMKLYVQNHTKDGAVNFYSNDFSAGNETKVEFQPATTNDFYFLTQDTMLYTDQICKTPAKSIVDGQTYYYGLTYYEVGNPKPQINVIALSGGNALRDRVKVNAENICYLVKGVKRTTVLHGLTKEKAVNITKTADYLTQPKWENAENVTVFLGNNGRIKMHLLGELTISKEVINAEGHIAPKEAEFNFELQLTAPQDRVLKEVYHAQLFDKKPEGEVANGSEFLIKNGDSFILKDHQVLHIYGLEDGTTYRITEEKQVGFTEESTGATRDIIAGETSQASFRNTYQAEATEVTLHATKNLQGRRLKAGEFTFLLKDEAGDILEKISNEEDGTVQFHALTYAEAGTYRYTISEEAGADKTVCYDDTVYQVIITVEDNGQGYLKATVEDDKKALVFYNKVKPEPSITSIPSPTPVPQDPPKTPGGNTQNQQTSQNADSHNIAPDTGDANSILPYILTLFSSCVILGGCVILLMKKRK